MSTYIIAEAGVNHNGSVDLAMALVKAARQAGADAVKFQTFTASLVATQSASKAPYQVDPDRQMESQAEMLRLLELNEDAHRALVRHCQELGIQFLSTPFDLAALDLLTTRLDVSELKLASGEITNSELLLRAAQSKKPIILSTGMSTLGEIEAALAVLAFGYLSLSERPGQTAFHAAFCSNAGQQELRERVTLLHCTTEYPAPFAAVNLRAMTSLALAFGLRVGISDHTPGIAVPLAAVAMGATMVEKHFTLDRHLPGPDHKASLEPDELAKMIEGIRQVEQALGSPLKRPAHCELNNRQIARRSLVATRPIGRGEMFSEQNLGAKRPGGGMSPMLYWDLIGSQARREYQADELIVA